MSASIGSAVRMATEGRAVLIVDVPLAVTIIVLGVSLWEQPRVGRAIACAVLSAAWWPANNGVLEGPVLLGLTADHGFVVADLLGVFGIVSAAAAIRRAPRQPVRRRDALIAIACIALLGAAAAALSDAPGAGVQLAR